MARNDLGEIQPIALLRPSQMVAAELRQRILRGDWHEGAPLPPTSVLAERLGISRHHLREALRLLEHDGLIRIERGPTGGVSLAIPDEQAVTRILEGILARYGTPLTDMNVARAAIDQAVAGLAAEKATREDIAELEAIVDEEHTRGWSGLPCTEFHMAVARAAHNQPLLVVVRAAWPIGTRTGEQISEKLEAIRKEPSLRSQAVQVHRDLVRAMTARDCARASSLMREHHAAILAHYEPTIRGLKIGSGNERYVANRPAERVDPQLEPSPPDDHQQVRSRRGTSTSSGTREGVSEILTCQTCGREFERIVSPGRKPRICPDCRS